MKVVIFKPRPDLPFKAKVPVGRLPPKTNRPLIPIRQHWENFNTKLSEDHKAKGDEVVIIEKICNTFSLKDVKNNPADLYYIPHTDRKRFEGNHKCRYYMQTVYPWLFTIDSVGICGGASYVNNILPNLGDNGKTYQEFKKRIWKRETKFNQNENLLETNLTKYGDYILVPLQLPHDWVIKYHSNIEVREFVMSIIDWAKTSNVNVVFKTHPINPNSLIHFKGYIEKSKNCYWIENTHLHDLLNRAKACYVINSGTGMEAMLHEIPVVRFGDAEYNNAVIYGDINDLTKTWESVNMVNKPGMISKYAKFYNYFINEICYDTRIDYD